MSKKSELNQTSRNLSHSSSFLEKKLTKSYRNFINLLDKNEDYLTKIPLNCLQYEERFCEALNKKDCKSTKDLCTVSKFDLPLLSSRNQKFFLKKDKSLTRSNFYHYNHTIDLGQNPIKFKVINPLLRSTSTKNINRVESKLGFDPKDKKIFIKAIDKKQPIDQEESNNLKTKKIIKDKSISSNNLPKYKQHKCSIKSSFHCTSIAGKDDNSQTKINQDSYIVLENIFNLSEYSIFGIMDGHGEQGHLVSQYLKKRISEYFTRISNYVIDKNEKEHSMDLITEVRIIKLLMQQKYKVINNFFDIVANELLLSSNIDITNSGSTAVIVFKIGLYTITANVGDSRAILVNEQVTKKNNNNKSSMLKFVSEQLSIDHKPTVNSEKQRILKYGGEIHQYTGEDSEEGEPLRVWVKGKNYPGIATTRSVGDQIAENIGVIHTPDIKIKLLNESSRFIVVASDGIWDYLSNDDVMNIVIPYFNSGKINLASEVLCQKAVQEWERNVEIGVDDVTAVVCFIGH